MKDPKSHVDIKDFVVLKLLDVNGQNDLSSYLSASLKSEPLLSYATSIRISHILIKWHQKSSQSRVFGMA